MDRIAHLLSTSDRSSRIIEIGAGYCPVAPKAAGWNSHVVDHATKDELRAKYARAGVDLAVVEDVDTIWRSGMLHEAVPAGLHGSFDTLIASHVIEHIPDFIGFLASAERLLTTDGTVVLAIPDRRYCFDYFKPLTLTGDILEAHAAHRTRHTRRTAWNHVAYSVLLDGGLACQQAPLRQIKFIDPFITAAATEAAFRDDTDTPYVDYHVWHFTPAGFALVMLELGQLGMIDWHTESLDGPETFEFFTVLRRGAVRIADPAALQVRRMGLLQQLMLETQVQIGFAMMGGGLATDAARGATSAALEDTLSHQLAQISAQLADQAARLREIERTARWVRAILHPAQTVWRTLRDRLRKRA